MHWMIPFCMSYAAVFEATVEDVFLFRRLLRGCCAGALRLFFTGIEVALRLVLV